MSERDKAHDQAETEAQADGGPGGGRIRVSPRVSRLTRRVTPRERAVVYLLDNPGETVNRINVSTALLNALVDEGVLSCFNGRYYVIPERADD